MVLIINYISSIFNTILESFNEDHLPELDFTTTFNHKKILWHPNLGDLTFQGSWSKIPDGQPLYDILKDSIKAKLVNQKFNWLKIYVSKNKDNEIISECLLNNENWEEGKQIITEYAKKWKLKGFRFILKPSVFLAQKQFIMFRRCDKYD